MTDLLIVGGGLAAMAAALEAADGGASVLLASAGPGSSELAQGGIAAAVGEDDEPGLHAADTLAAAAGLGDPAAAGLLTGEAPATAAWLEARGVAFDRGPGGLDLALEAAHSRPRVLHAGGDASGAAIAAALRRVLTDLPFERMVCLDGARLEALLLDGEGVTGARLRLPGGAVREVGAGATLLATGGFAGLFPRSTTVPLCDGTGLLAALRAGAELADLELVQFHPTAYAGPGPTFLLTEALRGAGAHLVDEAGRRFLLDTDPHGELAPRAVVSRAIAGHLLRPGRPCVFLDARHLGEAVLRSRFPGFVARCRRRGLDPADALVPVAPAAHYTMGGIVTDGWGRTGVPGLLAAGECARTGVHGANRLASNSLLEAAVFGRRSARAALAALPGRGHAGSPRWAGPVAADPPEARRLLGEAAGPLRSGAALAAARRLAPDGTLSALVLEAALLREESRGAHVRTDHPAEEPAWAAREVAVRVDRDGAPLVAVRPRRSLAGAA